ncbi:hypothetical protein [Mucilaginibacter sp. dw_454]|uniref:hypothetical protein n=1 Tax=Mucilaginibacter sp. dw_454 TaxID=2720079 RepID=UPI001BD2C99E|nr:hypothetical protein [Mucilaginibacter sp. dw_454]
MVKISNCKLFSLLLPMLLVSAFVNAQKLPNVQKGGLRAPASVKIDGKATEWNNEFQAYNHAIQASYTLSNDDNKLYLVVSTNRKEIINKIINGGVSLVINKTKKTVVDAPSITYPAYNDDEKAIIPLNAIFDIQPGAPNADHKMDSLVTSSNSTLNDKTKFIRLSGLKEDVDTLISVYNKDGIKATSAFDNNKTFTLEMSVDLKLLGLSIDNKTPFNYNIRFNEIKLDYVPGVDITRNTEGVITQMKVKDLKLANSYISALSTTDCWGTYVLAK